MTVLCIAVIIQIFSKRQSQHINVYFSDRQTQTNLTADIIDERQQFTETFWDIDAKIDELSDYTGNLHKDIALIHKNQSIQHTSLDILNRSTAKNLQKIVDVVQQIAHISQNIQDNTQLNVDKLKKFSEFVQGHTFVAAEINKRNSSRIQIIQETTTPWDSLPYSRKTCSQEAFWRRKHKSFMRRV